MKEYLAIFAAVFLAELGDKTQVATLLFASNRELSRLGVFVAASLALVLAVLLAVVAGSFASRYLDRLPLKLIAGVAFVGIGVWLVVEQLRNQ